MDLNKEANKTFKLFKEKYPNICALFKGDNEEILILIYLQGYQDATTFITDSLDKKLNGK